jgi:adenosine deaminase
MNSAAPYRLDPGLHQLLCRMPKAELHIHIEGSLEPELIFALAQRNGVALSYPSVGALRAAYAFSDLQSFLDIYYAGASVLLHEQDFFDMAWAYLQRAAADHVVHAETLLRPTDPHRTRRAHGHRDPGPVARLPRRRAVNWASARS